MPQQSGCMLVRMSESLFVAMTKKGKSDDLQCPPSNLTLSQPK